MDMACTALVRVMPEYAVNCCFSCSNVQGSKVVCAFLILFVFQRIWMDLAHYLYDIYIYMYIYICIYIYISYRLSLCAHRSEALDVEMIDDVIMNSC